VVGVVVVAVAVMLVTVVSVFVRVLTVAVLVMHVPQSAGQVTAIISFVTGESQNSRFTLHISWSSAAPLHTGVVVVTVVDVAV
jgi:hypothetical protein